MTVPADLGSFATRPEEFTGMAVSEMVRHWASVQPDAPAYISPAGTTTWAEYDAAADAVHAALDALPAQLTDTAAVHLPDTAGLHAVLVGAYRAGVRVAASGARSGPAEVAHLMDRSGSRVLITSPRIREVPARQVLEGLEAHGAKVEHVILVDDPARRSGDFVVNTTRAAPTSYAQEPSSSGRGSCAHRTFDVDDVCMLNSTSGTTGRPKLVTQTQRRWTAFCAIAARTGGLTTDEVVAAFVPAPFGFGLWTSHFLPALLGRPALVMERFDPAVSITMMRRHRATVLACVSTQFRMMLHCSDPPLGQISELRVMYTGGESVPYAEARRFEEVTGAKVLQFYGSNETGAASATSITDSDETRLRTGGHLLPEMDVRVFDGHREVTGPGVRRGQPAVRGVLASGGYFEDDEANAELFTDDGWILLGDIVEVDEHDRLHVVGRLADLIIRGGKNISAVEVEDRVREHPRVAMVAAVGVADPVFGERLCVVVTCVPDPGSDIGEASTGTDSAALTLDALTDWLRARGVTREYLPERLLVVNELPTAPGGKIAKGEVRTMAERLLEEDKN